MPPGDEQPTPPDPRLVGFGTPPLAAMRLRAVAMVWALVTLLAALWTAWMIATGTPFYGPWTLVGAATWVLLAVTPVSLYSTGRWRLATSLLTFAALGLAAASVMTPPAPSPAILPFVVLIPIAAILFGDLWVGWAAAVASGVLAACVVSGGPIPQIVAASLSPLFAALVVFASRRVGNATVQAAQQTTLRLREQDADLSVSQSEAQAALEAKTRFLANMSHEIRTPLNGVIGMSTLLMDTPLSEVQRDYAETIRTSSEALLTVINDVLDLSKANAGQLALAEEPVDPTRLIEQVAQLFAREAGEPTVELVLDISPHVPALIVADAGRIRQVLVNLIGNALKFTESGEVIVRVSIEEERENSVVLAFEVQDTGPGVDEDSRTRLFEEFYQADASTTRRHGGTGLGLAICARLVDLMGGRIGVDSTPGLGSTFWFTLPARLAESALQQHARSLPRPLRLLVVDATSTQRQVTVKQLLSWGATADTATDTAQALTMASQAARDDAPYDIALVDLHLPDCDGLEVARQLQAVGQAELPVVLMSGASLTSAPMAFHEAGVRHVLTKPVRYHRLFDVLSHIAVPPPSEGEESAGEVAVPQGRVLIVEDNLINQKVARHMVDKLGYAADVVANGRQAVEAIRRTPYCVILMDIHMPVMDGFEATAAIRLMQQDAPVSTPIIAMTADALPEDRQTCLRAGMDAHLPKPLQQEVLAPMLRHWCRPEVRGRVH